ncbi:O-antigen polymerase [uncultured Draconibacterium sp.]|uniref:O-antigen polymerase n=1 Tax=uncultured Draconibacterium sp. TaxID=1573823 RepID=UPI0029C96B75|nr:O-antigen polymerase [uncultured Draconibacterium sp.]
MKRFLLFILLFSVLVSGIKFFDLIILTTTLANSLYLASIGTIILYLILSIRFKVKLTTFDKGILVFYLGLIINIFVMLLYSNLTLYKTFFGTLNLLGFFFYFFLKRLKPDTKTVLQIIIVLSFIVSILMLAQQVVKPFPLFNHLLEHENFLVQRGTVRARIPGMAFVVISCLYYIELYFQKFKLKHIILSLFFYVIIILQGFRSITLAISLCIFILYFSSIKKRSFFSVRNLQFILILLIAVIGILQIPYIQGIINGILEAQKNTVEIGSENIRINAAIYYLIEIKKHLWMYITGNGLALPFKTPDGLFAVDLGIWGFYSLAGLVPTIGLLWLLWKGYCLSPDKFMKLFFLYMLMNAFLFNAEVLRTGIFYIYSVMFYLLEEKNSNLNDHHKY